MALLAAPEELWARYAAEIDNIRSGRTFKRMTLRLEGLDVGTDITGGLRICHISQLSPDIWVVPAAMIRAFLRRIPLAAEGYLEMSQALCLPTRCSLEGPHVQEMTKINLAGKEVAVTPELLFLEGPPLETGVVNGSADQSLELPSGMRRRSAATGDVKLESQA